MTTSALTVIHIPHPRFGTVKELIDYIDRHWRESPHTVTMYPNLVDLHFIARGKLPNEGEALKYYDLYCCVKLRDLGETEMTELIDLARKRIADGEIRADWYDNLVALMQPHILSQIPFG